MKNLDKIYLNFLEKFKIVLFFISENFGDKNILKRKNSGLIPNRCFEIKNPQIKGYVFHGTGCDFRLKNCLIDVEFYDDYIGFTNWSFYNHVKNINPEITEIEVENFLSEKVNLNQLKYNGKIFELL